MKYVIIQVLLSLSVLSYGQNSFKGILLNKRDSSVIQFAVVKSLESRSFTLTNAEGEFSFQIPKNIKVLRFEISVIGFHETIVHHRTYKACELIYIEIQPFNLSAVDIKGLSATQTLMKAVEKIPDNYLDSSFASYSFFRQYQKVDSEFKNLIEAQTIILFKLSKAKKGIAVSHGYDVEQMRRSNFKFDINDFYYDQNSIAGMLSDDPVYYLMDGALNPNAFQYYTVNFDTTNKTDDIVIKYKCKEFTNDNHGISNKSELGWEDEGWEEGIITLDNKSFAFKKIERTSYRNKYFNYPKNNNWLLPSKTYYVEFVDGTLLTEYEQYNGKWFLKKMCQSYTNDYFGRNTIKKEFAISDIFEWYSDSITHFISTDIADKFYRSTNLPSCEYIYNKEFWNKTLPAFHFYKKEKIYKDIEKQSNIETQFENSSKPKK